MSAAEEDFLSQRGSQGTLAADNKVSERPLPQEMSVMIGACDLHSGKCSVTVVVGDSTLLVDTGTARILASRLVAWADFVDKNNESAAAK